MKIIETAIAKKDSSIIYPGIVIQDSNDAKLEKLYMIIGMSKDNYATLKSFDKNIINDYYNYPDDVLIINIRYEDLIFEHVLDCSLLHIIHFDKMNHLIASNKVQVMGDIPYSEVMKIKKVLTASDHISQNTKDEYLI